MPRNTSVVLDDQAFDFIAQRIGSGRYGSPGDVVKAGLALLAEEEVTVGTLRNAIIEGEESGKAMPFNGEAFLADMHLKHGF